MDRVLKRATWFAAATLGMSLALSFVTSAPVTAAPNPQAAKDGPKDKKDPPLKANPALKEKIAGRIKPWKWGMSSSEVFTSMDKEIDQLYAEKVSKAYNPKQQAALEKEAEKKKKDLRTKLIEFKGGAGVSGYEIKAPGEFTYKNGESAIEVPRPGGGERQLFFINDKLWKVYDHVHLTAKDAELGETWEQAIEKFTKDFGDKGKKVEKKGVSPAYFGVQMIVPEHYLFTDGTTQVRLIDHTKREDMTVRTVGIAYEDASMVEKLPTYRTNVEKKASDALVDKAGAPDPVPVKDDKKKDPKKK
jgi:hypothetical protein